MQFTGDTDRDWKAWGETDPYFGVLSAPQFHRDRLNEQTLEDFFSGGEKHVAHVLNVLRKRLRPDFIPSRVLDLDAASDA